MRKYLFLLIMLLSVLTLALTACAEEKFSVAINAGEGVVVSVDGKSTVKKGDSFSFNVTLEKDYCDLVVKSNEDVILKDGDCYRIDKVESNLSIEISATHISKLPQYTISIQATDGVSVINGGERSVKKGEDITFIAKLKNGYENLDVSAEGAEIIRDGDRFTIENIQKNIEVKATASRIPFAAEYTIKVNPCVGVQSSEYGEHSVLENGTFTFSLTAIEGYRLKSVKANGAEIFGVSGVYSVLEVKENLNIFIDAVQTHSVELDFEDNVKVDVAKVNVVDHGTAFRFKVEAMSGYRVSGVTSASENMHAESDGYYLIESVEKDFQVQISVCKTWVVDMECASQVHSTMSGEHVVDEGADISFKVTPDANYRIVSVKVNGRDILNAENEYEIKNIESDINIVVEAIRLFSITINAENAVLSVENVSIVDAGNDFEFEVAPEKDHHITAVSVSSGEIFEVNGKFVVYAVDADLIISITIKKYFTFTIETDLHSHSPQKGSHIINEKSSFYFSISCDEGYRVESVWANNEKITTEDNFYSLFNINQNILIKVHTVKQLRVTLTVGNQAQSAKAGTHYVDVGGNFAFEIAARQGYKVLKVEAGETDITNDAHSYLLENLAEDVDVVVTTIRVWTVTVNSNNATLSVSRITEVEHGANLEFSVEAHDNYRLKSVRKGSAYVERTGENSYTLFNISSDIIINIAIVRLWNIKIVCDEKIELDSESEIVLENGDDLVFEAEVQSGYKVLSPQITPSDSCIVRESGYEIKRYEITQISADLTINLISDVLGTVTVSLPDIGGVTYEYESLYVEEADDFAFSMIFDSRFVGGAEAALVTVVGHNVSRNGNVFTVSRLRGDITVNISPPEIQYYSVELNNAALGSPSVLSGDGTFYRGQTVVVQAQVKDDTTFIGWFENSDCQGTPISTLKSFSFAINADVVLYAKALQNVKMIVSAMDLLGGSCFKMNGTEYNYGETISLYGGYEAVSFEILPQYEKIKIQRLLINGIETATPTISTPYIFGADKNVEIKVYFSGTEAEVTLKDSLGQKEDMTVSIRLGNKLSDKEEITALLGENQFLYESVQEPLNGVDIYLPIAKDMTIYYKENTSQIQITLEGCGGFVEGDSDDKKVFFVDDIASDVWAYFTTLSIDGGVLKGWFTAVAGEGVQVASLSRSCFNQDTVLYAAFIEYDTAPQSVDLVQNHFVNVDGKVDYIWFEDETLNIYDNGQKFSYYYKYEAGKYNLLNKSSGTVVGQMLYEDGKLCLGGKNYECLNGRMRIYVEAYKEIEETPRTCNFYLDVYDDLRMQSFLLVPTGFSLPAGMIDQYGILMNIEWRDLDGDVCGPVLSYSYGTVFVCRIYAENTSKSVEFETGSRFMELSAIDISNDEYGGLYSILKMKLARVGYSFVGWSLEPDGNCIESFDEDILSAIQSLLTADSPTVYALWEKLRDFKDDEFVGSWLIDQGTMGEDGVSVAELTLDRYGEGELLFEIDSEEISMKLFVRAASFENGIYTYAILGTHNEEEISISATASGGEIAVAFEFRGEDVKITFSKVTNEDCSVTIYNSENEIAYSFEVPFGSVIEDEYTVYGYTLYCDQIGEAVYDYLPIKSNTFLFMLRTPVYRITYDANGAVWRDGTNGEITRAYWSEKSYFGDILHNDYIFLGWNTKANSKFGYDLKTLAISDDIYVYAIWAQRADNHSFASEIEGGIFYLLGNNDLPNGKKDIALAIEFKEGKIYDVLSDKVLPYYIKDGNYLVHGTGSFFDLNPYDERLGTMLESWYSIAVSEDVVLIEGKDMTRLEDGATIVFQSVFNGAGEEKWGFDVVFASDIATYAPSDAYMWYALASPVDENIFEGLSGGSSFVRIYGFEMPVQIAIKVDYGIYDFGLAEDYFLNNYLPLETIFVSLIGYEVEMHVLKGWYYLELTKKVYIDFRIATSSGLITIFTAMEEDDRKIYADWEEVIDISAHDALGLWSGESDEGELFVCFSESGCEIYCLSIIDEKVVYYKDSFTLTSVSFDTEKSLYTYALSDGVSLVYDSAALSLNLIMGGLTTALERQENYLSDIEGITLFGDLQETDGYVILFVDASGRGYIENGGNKQEIFCLKMGDEYYFLGEEFFAVYNCVEDIISLRDETFEAISFGTIENEIIGEWTFEERNGEHSILTIESNGDALYATLEDGLIVKYVGYVVPCMDNYLLVFTSTQGNEVIAELNFGEGELFKCGIVGERASLLEIDDEILGDYKTSGGESFKLHIGNDSVAVLSISNKTQVGDFELTVSYKVFKVNDRYVFFNEGSLLWVEFCYDLIMFLEMNFYAFT